MLSKKNSFSVLRAQGIRRDTAARSKACASCGSRFVPQFQFSRTCTFCRTPASSFLAARPYTDLTAARAA